MKTRANLETIDGFDMTTDNHGNPCVWENHYHCDHGYGGAHPEEWSSEWSCKCNDRCDVCGREVEPVESVWNGPYIDHLRALWEYLPEVGAPVSDAISKPERHLTLTIAELCNIVGSLGKKDADLAMRLLEIITFKEEKIT